MTFGKCRWVGVAEIAANVEACSVTASNALLVPHERQAIDHRGTDLATQIATLHEQKLERQDSPNSG